MKKWLQSKSFVTCLCVAAGGCIAANFIKLPKRTPLITNARMNPALEQAAPPLAVFIPPAFQERESSEAWRSMFALETLNRDPFAPAGIFLSGSGTNGHPNSPAFSLQAISIDGDKSLAVINQTVLAEGEMIDGYRIEKILPTQVHLSGAIGSVIATLTQRIQNQKTALGNPPAADPPAAPVSSLPAGTKR